MNMVVNIVYPLDQYEWGQPEAELRPFAEQHGGKDCGAGTCFSTNERDVDFIFDVNNTEGVQTFLAKLADWPHINYKIWVEDQ